MQMLLPFFSRALVMVNNIIRVLKKLIEIAQSYCPTATGWQLMRQLTLYMLNYDDLGIW